MPRGRDSLWHIYLADVSNIQKYNTQIQFWLIAIDVFSRYTWVQPLLDKTHQRVINGLKTLLKDGRKPPAWRSNHGARLPINGSNNLLKRENNYYYNTQNPRKASYAERVIRTLKTTMYRYFTQKQTYKYEDVLQDLVQIITIVPTHPSLVGCRPALPNTSLCCG